MESIYLKRPEEIRQWLKHNLNREKGIWVEYPKGKHSTLTHGQILEEILCYGWIDSSVRAKDQNTSYIYISPRNPKSNWSQTNRLLVERLTSEGRMQPRGQELVEAAKKSGAWEALIDVENLVIPNDLESAFKDYPGSKDNWLSFSAATQRRMLGWLKEAKTDKTRQHRLISIALNAADNNPAF